LRLIGSHQLVPDMRMMERIASAVNAEIEHRKDPVRFLEIIAVISS
jgi:hypothetical protein